MTPPPPPPHPTRSGMTTQLAPCSPVLTCPVLRPPPPVPPADDDDRDYMICRNMKISLGKLNGMQEEDREEILEEEVWIPVNAEAYIKRKSEEAHEAMKNSTRYKWEKRWMKKNRA